MLKQMTKRFGQAVSCGLVFKILGGIQISMQVLKHPYIVGY